jgi:xanthine dehydrogenase YagR molybdenum-binding subunit
MPWTSIPWNCVLRNWADKDYQLDLPWSSRRLKEAYQKGAEAFGWDMRIMTPRSMREGRELIGWGLASGTYPVIQTAGRRENHPDPAGPLCGAVRRRGYRHRHLYTILAQTAADHSRRRLAPPLRFSWAIQRCRAQAWQADRSWPVT